MDIAPAGPGIGPWVVLAIALAVVLAGAGLLLVRRGGHGRRPADGGTGPGPVEDDLPGFLESPPGFGGDDPRPPSGWPPLAPAPAAPAPPADEPAASGRRAVGLTSLALAALLLVAVAVAVGTLMSRSTSPGPDSRAEHPGRDERPQPPAEVRMRFSGLVLEQRAVGITATYPEVELTADRDGALARLTLPTWNCLSSEAPDDPEAAGCVPTRTEYAELRPPELEVTREGRELRFGGEFPTSTRPTGSPPEPTGRTYGVQISVSVDGDACRRPSAADGVLALGERQAASIDGELRLDC